MNIKYYHNLLLAAVMLTMGLSVPSVAQTVNLSIPTLPPGKSIVITYTVTINNPVPGGVTQISNQGQVSGSNITTKLTDDPAAAGVADPTVTPLTIPAGTATTTTVASSQNPSLTGQSVTFTATVVNGGPVTSGTVTFKEGPTTLAGPTPLNGSGQASFSTSALSEGDHTITAEFSGVSGTYDPSSGSISQRVDCPTSQSGNSFTNSCPITLNGGPSPATPYPSHITVSGLSGTISTMTVTLHGVTKNVPDDLDILLVSPTGQKMILVSDAGGTTPADNVTVTFDDAAPSSIGDNGGWGASNSTVTSKPVNYSGTADVFPAPAPAGPYASPAPTGAATLTSVFGGGTIDPNGTWSLYVVDPPPTTISGGWTLTFGALDVALPVELTSFQGSSSNGSVTLNWRTAAEVHNAGFEVQRAELRADTTYAPIASYLTRADLAGLGTSNIGRSYSLVDNDVSLEVGKEYLYRLIDVSTDGIRTEHSPLVIKVEGADQPEEMISGSLRFRSVEPNPASNDILVNFSMPESGATTVEIYSMDGKRIAVPINGRIFDAGEHQERVSVKELDPGVYTLRLMVGRQTRVRQFVVVR